MANFQEGSTRLNAPSSNDFTASGTTYNAPYIVVKFDANGAITPVTAITDEPAGIIYNCPTASGTADVLSVNQQGSAKITCGGNISVNQYVTFNSAGKAVVATQTAGGSQPAVRVIGRALEAGSNGKVIAIQSLFFFY
jgi:hypothetical protein